MNILAKYTRNLMEISVDNDTLDQVANRISELRTK